MIPVRPFFRPRTSVMSHSGWRRSMTVLNSFPARFFNSTSVPWASFTSCRWRRTSNSASYSQLGSPTLNAAGTTRFMYRGRSGSFDSINRTRSANAISPANVHTLATLSGMPSRSRCRKTVSPQERRSLDWFCIERSPSTHEYKAIRQFQQLERFVDVYVDAAQDNLRAVFTVSEFFHPAYQARIESPHRRKVHSNLTRPAIQLLGGLFERQHESLFVDMHNYRSNSHSTIRSSN